MGLLSRVFRGRKAKERGSEGKDKVKPLSDEELEAIVSLRDAGMSLTQISKELKRPPKTISVALKRCALKDQPPEDDFDIGIKKLALQRA